VSVDLPASVAERARVLMLVPYFNRDGVGEDYSNFQWIQGLSEHCSATVLTIARPGHVERVPSSVERLIEFPDSRLHLNLLRHSGSYERFSRKACPNYLPFHRKAARWIQAHAERFDLIHQFSPLALRYPTPALGFLERHATPFVAGPLGGALPTPPAMRTFPWMPEPRQVDRLRFRLDPWLRATYERADCLVGAGPYVKELLRGVRLRRFEVISEMGVERTWPRPRVTRAPGELRLLFVGRLVPTKGVLHAIRCLAALADLPGITLEIVGEGTLETTCRAEIARLGLERRVRLSGRLERDAVFERYADADVFLFPSYREPTGHVVYEALSFGLPVVTTTIGGPAHIVTDACGIRVPPAPAEAFEASLAAAIRRLTSTELRQRMGASAIERIEAVALWPRKIEAMLRVYAGVLERRGADAVPVAAGTRD